MRKNKIQFLNPEKQVRLIPYSIYSHQKFATKQLQSQRSNAQQTISYLERQAKKSKKQLFNKQKSLVSYCHLKEDRFDDFKKKQEWRKKQQISLQQQKKINSHLRQSSMSKRSMAKQQWHSQNKQSASNIKNNTMEWERRFNEQKQLENSLLRKRNELFSRALALGTQHSKVRSLYRKNAESSRVKSDLISVQQKIKARQIQYISFLTTRQQELLEIVNKNKKYSHHYKNTLQQMKTLTFEQLTKRVAKSVQKSNSPPQSSRSDSLII